MHVNQDADQEIRNSRFECPNKIADMNAVAQSLDFQIVSSLRVALTLRRQRRRSRRRSRRCYYRNAATRVALGMICNAAAEISRFLMPRAGERDDKLTPIQPTIKPRTRSPSENELRARVPRGKRRRMGRRCKCQ